METRKLYYEDCHLWDFSAMVLTCEQTGKGFLVTLDATAFYPEGGGQACDTGTLGGVRVLDVQERGEAVIHLCDGPLAVGEMVAGHIDVTRRFDLMQQHAGEHIVSGIIHKKYGYHNVGFHVGSAVMEIDFDGMIPAEDLARIETEANEAVWAALPIRCWYPSREELPHVPYRTKRALDWPVRIVEIPGYDSCACCGVHVGNTGEIGLIKIISCVKFHQGVRIELLCGGRALGYVQQVCEQNRLVSQTFSAKPLETGAAAKRISETLEAEKARAAGLEKQVFKSIAESYVNQSNVLHFADDLRPVKVRELADAIAGRISGVTAVFSGTDGNGYSVCLVSRTEDVRELGKGLNQALNGRGGGKKEAFQGTVSADRTQIEAFFQDKFGGKFVV